MYNWKFKGFTFQLDALLMSHDHLLKCDSCKITMQNDSQCHNSPIHLMKALNRVYMDEYSLEFVEQAMVDSLKVLRLPLAVC